MAFLPPLIPGQTNIFGEVFPDYRSTMYPQGSRFSTKYSIDVDYNSKQTAGDSILCIIKQFSEVLERVDPRIASRLKPSLTLIKGGVVMEYDYTEPVSVYTGNGIVSISTFQSPIDKLHDPKVLSLAKEAIEQLQRAVDQADKLILSLLKREMQIITLSTFQNPIASLRGSMLIITGSALPNPLITDVEKVVMFLSETILGYQTRLLKPLTADFKEMVKTHLTYLPIVLSNLTLEYLDPVELIGTAEDLDKAKEQNSCPGLSTITLQ